MKQLLSQLYKRATNKQATPVYRKYWRTHHKRLKALIASAMH